MTDISRYIYKYIGMKFELNVLFIWIKKKKLLSMIVDLNYIALDLILIRDLSGILELGKSIS